MSVVVKKNIQQSLAITNHLRIIISFNAQFC